MANWIGKVNNVIRQTDSITLQIQLTNDDPKNPISVNENVILDFDSTDYETYVRRRLAIIIARLEHLADYANHVEANPIIDTNPFPAALPPDPLLLDYNKKKINLDTLTDLVNKKVIAPDDKTVTDAQNAVNIAFKLVQSTIIPDIVAQADITINP